MPQLQTLGSRPGIKPVIEPAAVYSIADVQALLSISRRTVLRLIGSKRLCASRVGRQYRIPGACILDYLAEASIDPARVEEAFAQFLPSPAALLLARRLIAPRISEEEVAADATAAIRRVRYRKR